MPPLALMIVVVLLLGLHASYYWPYLWGGAFVPFPLEADRLIQGQQTGNGSLLWLFLSGMLGFFGADPISAARILGVIGTCLVILAMTSYYARFITRINSVDLWFAVGAGLTYFVLSAPVAVWIIGGSEQVLVAALLAFAVSLMFRLLDHIVLKRSLTLLLSLCLGLLCLARPEGFVFAVVCFFVLALFVWRTRQGRGLRRCFLLLLFPLLLSAFQGGFYLYYYGQGLPNDALSYHIAGHGNAEGVSYWFDGLLSLFPYSFFGIGVSLYLLLKGVKPYKHLLLLSVSLAWSVVILTMEGDDSPAFQYFIPILVALCYALIEGCLYFQRKVQQQTVTQMFNLTVVLMLVPFVAAQFISPANKAALQVNTKSAWYLETEAAQAWTPSVKPLKR